MSAKLTIKALIQRRKLKAAVANLPSSSKQQKFKIQLFFASIFPCAEQQPKTHALAKSHFSNKDSSYAGSLQMHLLNPLWGSDWEVRQSLPIILIQAQKRSPNIYCSYSQDFAKRVTKARRLNPYVGLQLDEFMRQHSTLY